MKLEEAIERLKEDVKYADLRDIVDDDCTICFIEDIETVLQELERLQKENEDKKTYEFGLIVGTKRERDWWQNKIREKIEEIKSRMNDDCLALHEFQREAKIDVLYDLLKEE